MTSIFSPLHLGPLPLPNRIVMAPMTRNRAGGGNAPTALNATHYAQRASAGLIVADSSGLAAGHRLSGHARHSQRRTDRRLEARHKRGARGRWPDFSAALACRAHLASVAAARWRAAGCAVGDRAGRTGLDARRHEALRHAARAGDGRNPGHRRAVPARRGQRQGGGIRRHRSACRARLSARSVFARQDQQAHRPLWRQRRKPRPHRCRSDGSRRRCLGRRARRRAFVADQSGLQRYFGQRSGQHVHNGSARTRSPRARLSAPCRTRPGRSGPSLPSPASGGGIGGGPLDAKFFRPLWRTALVANKAYDLARANAVLQSGDADLISFATLFIANPDLPSGCVAAARSMRPSARRSTAARGRLYGLSGAMT